jgi:hypothetical protein
MATIDKPVIGMAEAGANAAPIQLHGESKVPDAAVPPPAAEELYGE